MSGIPGSPLGYARDIAEGNAPFSALQLKKMTPEDLKKLMANLNIALREVRTQSVADRDVDGMRRRAHKLQRLNSAVMLVETHAKKLRIIL
jgi:ribosomal protein L29